MQQVSAEEAKARLEELVKAALAGEQIFIRQDAEHQVQLIPVPQTAPNRVAGRGQGLFTMHDDFDAPLADFAAYESAISPRGRDVAVAGIVRA